MKPEGTNDFAPLGNSESGTTENHDAPLPHAAVFVDLLGVRYLHVKTHDGGDLYLTQYGIPFAEHLQPKNWFAKGWFDVKRKRLLGTSVVYHVPTRTVKNRQLQLVVKWSRVGEDVTMDSHSIDQFIHAEFNSPFEEFSLLMELRDRTLGPSSIKIRTQKPMAIYVPSERLQLWQTGRSEQRIADKIARHPGVELDILRQYVLLYGWVKGIDLVEAASQWQASSEERTRTVGAATSVVIHDLEQKGYRVADMKAAHIIVRPQCDGSLLRSAHGELIYALIDYELLARTPEHEQVVRGAHRRHYLEHMARRFECPTAQPMPPHLSAMNILGVDYIHGHCESTGGQLWVAGKDPNLFNYFLPERWRRTLKESLSPTNSVFRTLTKDSINLVWRVSRVGERPDLPTSFPRAAEIIQHGYNSPFEEFAAALTLSGTGFRTVYPRAIYMTGHKVAPGSIVDSRRHEAMANLLTREGDPVLSPEHDYITIWGFWNGLDEWLAAYDGRFFRGIDAEHACREDIITDHVMQDLVENTHQRLRQRGYEHLRLKPDHLLISFDPENRLVHDTFGKPAVRLCQFDLIRKISTANSADAGEGSLRAEQPVRRESN